MACLCVALAAWHFWNARQADKNGSAAKVAVAPIELYDLSTDIGETHNIADQHPEIVKQMNLLFQQAHTPSQNFSFSKK